MGRDGGKGVGEGKSDTVKEKVEGGNLLELGQAKTRQSPEAVFVPQIRAWRRRPGPQSWRGGS
jgi:hypothetical protein